MSWLYDRRDQLDGLRPFVEIAYHVTYGIDPCDRDDVEQDIVIVRIPVKSATCPLQIGRLSGPNRPPYEKGSGSGAGMAIV